MGGAVSAITCAICSVASAVGCAVGKVACTVGKVAQSAICNPVQTVADIGAVVSGNPELIPAINAANVVAKGGCALKAVEAAGVGYAGGAMASGLSGNFGSALGCTAAGQIAGNSITGGAIAGIMGQNPITGLMAGAVNTGESQLLAPVNQAVNSFLKCSVYNPLTSAVTGNSPDAAVQAIQSGALPSSDAVLPSGAVINPEAMAALNNCGLLGCVLNSNSCNLPNLNLNISGLAPSASSTLFGSSQPQIRHFGAPYKSSVTGAMPNLSTPWIKEGSQGITTATQDMAPAAVAHPANQPINVAALLSQLTPELSNAFLNKGYGTTGNKCGSLLGSPYAAPLSSTGYKSGGNVKHFLCGGATSWGSSCKCFCTSQYNPSFISSSKELQNAAKQRTPTNIPALHQIDSVIAPNWHYGASCWSLGDPSNVVTPMVAGTSLAKGGLPEKYHGAMPKGHNPEFITGLTGYYACGGGTGQSDDIPAMLHDGDYVMDAETVSALGDGSSKAGKTVLDHFMHQIPHKDQASGNPVPAKIADGEYVLPASFVTSLGQGDNKRGAKMLDMMREELREHKRSAPENKIPPKAKSPLDYLKEAEG